MQFEINNLSGENIILFSSDKYFSKKAIVDFCPKLRDLLNDINNDSWIKSVDHSKLRNLIFALKANLQPMLKFENVVLQNNSHVMENLWMLPKYIYALSIKLFAGKITLNYSMHDIGNLFAEKMNGESTNIKLTLQGNNASKQSKKVNDSIASTLTEFQPNPENIEPADINIQAKLQDNAYDYTDSNDAMNQMYASGYEDGSDSLPIFAIILAFVIIIIAIIAVGIIIFYIYSSFKKNNTNVNVTNHVTEKVHKEEINEMII
jgi:hypothetical protein